MCKYKYNKIKILNFFDIYSQNFLLHFDQSDKFHSKIGQFFGLLSILSFLTIILIYVQILMSRKNFSVLTNNLLDYSSSINLTNTPILFSLIDNNNKLIKFDKKLFNFYFQIYNSISNQTTNISLVNCENSSYIQMIKSKLNIEIEYGELKYFYCVKENENLFLKGRKGRGNYTYIYFKLNTCDNNTIINNKTNQCYSNSKIFEILKGSKLILTYFEGSLDHHNYKHPVQIQSRTDEFPLNLQIHKTITYIFDKSDYKSDNGIMFNNIDYYTFFTFRNFRLDFQLNENYSNLLTIKFIASDYSYEYERRYLKFQDIMTNVISYIHGIYIFLHLILYYIIKKLLYMNVINHLIFKNKNINKNNNINNINNISNNNINNISYTNINNSSKNNSKNNSKNKDDKNNVSFSFQINKNGIRNSNNTYNNKKNIRNILKSNSFFIYNLNSLNNELSSHNYLLNKVSNQSIININRNKNYYNNNIKKLKTVDNTNKFLFRKSVIINKKDQKIRKFSKKYKTIIDYLLNTQQKINLNFFDFFIPVKCYKYNKNIFYYIALKEILLNNISVENIYKNSQFYKEYKNIIIEDNYIYEKNNFNINNNLSNNNYELKKI